MKLLVYQENDMIEELQLESGQTYMVGRGADCEVKLEKLPGISRKHFKLEEEAPGQWKVTVLSEVKLVEFQKEYCKEFLLTENGSFYLDPYIFKFHTSEVSTQDAQNPLDLASAQTGEEALEEVELTENSIVDEKTKIQSFSGLPYIKIILENQGKSDYFRLEGNLWVIGRDEGASIRLQDPFAAPHHLEISKTDKGFFVMDLGSKEGTKLNGQNLKTREPSRLHSGDLLTIGATSLQFELRDAHFKEKFRSIPVTSHKNSLMFFDQEVALVSFDEETLEEGGVEEIQEASPPKKKKRWLMSLGAALFLLIAIGKDLIITQEEPIQEENLDPFSRLAPVDQKIVIQTYKLANQLYLNKNYELALVQLDKVHSIIPVYKESKKLEKDCMNARDIQQQKALREQQLREQEAIENQVKSFIAQCEKEYAHSDDIEGAKSCLVPVSDMDPNNPRITQLITEVTARREEKNIRENIRQEQADKVRRGKELYQKAQALHRSQKWHEAIEAYENHIHSGLPDPRGLVKTSKRNLASIESQIKSQKDRFLNEAQSKYSQALMKEAIHFARQAQKIDPYDLMISSFIYKTEKELTRKMRAIYVDSIIEERFGNIQASQSKWEEILKTDREDGEYYLKAKRKMRNYGFKY